MDMQLGRQRVSRDRVKASMRQRSANLVRSVALAALGTLGLGSTAAMATEGGGNSYPIGVETNSNVGMMLPEGLHGFLYYQHYHAGSLKDNNGNDSKQAAQFKLDADLGAARLSYVWPGVRLFGANIETRVVQPFGSVNLSLGINRPGNSPLDRSGNRAGLADTAFAPIILGWHLGDYHQTIGVDTHLADGTYDPMQRVNLGRNYYQIAPFFAFTWFVFKNFDIDAKVRYGFNTRNKATDYQSGDELTIEFSAGYRPFSNLQLGLNGYIYRQTTDDKQHGLIVNGNGNRGSVNALGPYLAFNVTPKIPVVVKAQFEFGARNRPQGTRIWVQTKVPF
jgi:hypothetical protein